MLPLCLQLHIQAPASPSGHCFPDAQAHISRQVLSTEIKLRSFFLPDVWAQLSSVTAQTALPAVSPSQQKETQVCGCLGHTLSHSFLHTIHPIQQQILLTPLRA